MTHIWVRKLGSGMSGGWGWVIFFNALFLQFFCAKVNYNCRGSTTATYRHVLKLLGEGGGAKLFL